MTTIQITADLSTRFDMHVVGFNFQGTIAACCNLTYKGIVSIGLDVRHRSKRIRSTATGKLWKAFS